MKSYQCSVSYRRQLNERNSPFSFPQVLFQWKMTPLHAFFPNGFIFQTPFYINTQQVSFIFVYFILCKYKINVCEFHCWKEKGNMYMYVYFPPFSLLAWNFVVLKLENLDNHPDIFSGSRARNLDVSPAPHWTSAMVTSLWLFPHLSGGLKAVPAIGRLEGSNG